METTQKAPEQPTKKRLAPSLSQLWIGGTGLFGLMYDDFKFGDDRYKDVPSNGTFAFLIVITLVIGYYAWKSSRSSYRDAIIVVYAIVVYTEALRESTDANKIGINDLVSDLIWIGVAYAFYRGSKKTE